MYRCSYCYTDLPASAFSARADRPRSVVSRCKVCTAATRNKKYSQEYYQKHKQKCDQNTADWRENNPKKAREGALRAYYRNWYSALYSRVKRRARKRGIQFEVTREYVKQLKVDTCPVFGVPLVLEPGVQDNSPSLDRVIPALGYVEGNLRIISNRANRMKYDGTAAEHEAIAAYIKREGGK